MDLFSSQAVVSAAHAVGWVLVPLAVLGAAAFGLIAERSLVLWQGASKLSVVAAQGVEACLATLPARHAARDWLAPVIANGGLHSAPLWWLEVQLESGATRIEKSLNRGLWLLDTIVTAAPLVGLFGTVTGMMEAFRLIGANGVVNPSGVSGGVAQALIATAIGLVIAVCSLIAFNALTQRVDATLDEMQSLGAQLLANLRRERESDSIDDGATASVHTLNTAL
ncbi:biopolymer transport protein ExbB [Pararobbsia alpina]|uniref:MotA/TolQ/ExbB proton channel family protein n=1 Tax=Pararobbsia alpina TaxID=621374 RepID=UPI0039A7726B